MNYTLSNGIIVKQIGSQVYEMIYIPKNHNKGKYSAPYKKGDTIILLPNGDGGAHGPEYSITKEGEGEWIIV